MGPDAPALQELQEPKVDKSVPRLYRVVRVGRSATPRLAKFDNGQFLDIGRDPAMRAPDLDGPIAPRKGCGQHAVHCLAGLASISAYACQANGGEPQAVHHVKSNRGPCSV